MTTKVLKSADDIEALSRFISSRGSFPITVTITKGSPRADQQNRLAQRWNADISRQIEDQTFEDIRTFNKLHFGVPILRAENEAFRIEYDRVFKGMSYEEKVNSIQVFDLPVTRLLTTKQMSLYMDEVLKYWTEKGFVLTSPDDLGRQEGF